MDGLIDVISSRGLLSFLVVMLIISMFVNLFFINSRLLNKMRDRNRAKRLPSEIQNFLNSQAYKTANAHKFRYIPKLYDFVVKFRSAYLRIESKCIDREIDSPEYWNLLNAKINELVKVASTYIGNKPLVNIKKKIELIKALVSESEAVADKQKILDCLDKFYQVCDSNSNESRIAEYDKKLNKIILRFTDKYYAKMDRLVKLNKDYIEKGRSAIDSLEDSARSFDNMTQKLKVVDEPTREFLGKCKDNSQQIKDGVQNVRDSFYQLEQKVHSAREGEGSGTEHAKETSKELSELSELIQVENEKEISRLRKVIENQKQTIHELERQLDNMLHELRASDGLDSAQGGMSEIERQRNIAIIESLKSNLKDAEYCIQVLEVEIENLKERSAGVDEEFRMLDDKEKMPIGESEVNSLELVIDDLRLEVESKSKENDLLKIVANFAVELFKGETWEDLSLLLYETLGAMDMNTVLKIYSPSRTFEVCASGKIPVRLATVIDGLHVNETSTNRGSFFFKYKNFGGAVQAKETTGLSNTEIEHILTLTTIANKTFDSIRLFAASKTQNQKISTCENTIKRTFSDVDQAFEKISRSATTAIEDSFRHIRELGRSSGLNAAQIAKISRLESQALEDINSEKVTKLKVKKAFLEALSNLESIRF